MKVCVWLSVTKASQNGDTTTSWHTERHTHDAHPMPNGSFVSFHLYYSFTFTEYQGSMLAVAAPFMPRRPLFRNDARMWHAMLDSFRRRFNQLWSIRFS